VLLNRRKSQGGQAVIFVAVALPLLCGVLGLAFDIGFFEFMQRNAQTAADAGALAGAIDLPYGTAATGATAGTAANGFTNGSGGVTVTVNNPPATGPHAGGTCGGSSPSLNCNFVEVIVSQPEPTFFLKMLGIGPSATVAARAVATSVQGDCVFALSPTASSALNITLGWLNLPNCAIIVDSSSSNAFTGFLNVVTANQIGVVGGGIGSGTGWGGCFLCFFTPSPVNVPPLADPLAYLPAPAVAACAGTVKTISSGTTTVNPSTGCYNVSVTGSANVTFMPGEYSAITVSSSASPTLTFNSGLYVIQGGGLSLTGSGSTIEAIGVTFYMGPSAGSVTVNGIGNTMNLVAQTTGTYAGILFFQDRSNASAACIGGCGGSVSGLLNFVQIQGASYFPDAALSMNGCCQTPNSSTVCTPPYCSAYEITVAKTLSFTFDYFGDDYSSLPGGSPIKRTLLVE
jgi:hypothetical protein